jgi:hypothetical protein
MSVFGGARHLARRFIGSLSRQPPDEHDEQWAESHLLAHEAHLWRRMSNADRRHAILVARRFAAIRTAALGPEPTHEPSRGEPSRGEPSRDEMAAALLHDVGKIESGLGTFGRVAATVLGPRTLRFRSYHDHERIGADWLAEGGSTAATVQLVHRHGPAADALSLADDI